MTVQLNSVGIIFEVQLWDDSIDDPLNISTATTKQLRVTYPSGRVRTFAASFTTNGSDGRLSYTTIAGDLNEIGTYKIEAYIDMATFTGYSAAGYFPIAGDV